MDLISYNIATININTITNTTKLDALRTFLRTMELDIIFLQEVENDQLSLPGYSVICNVDHGRRGTAIALREYIQYSHVEKSLDSRVTSLRVNNTTLACVYAPSGSAARAERERFFNGTLAYYLRHRTDHIVLGGDFNCVLRQQDATGYNISPSLQATVRQLHLCDVWEKLRARDFGPTYITQNSASRLDRFYVDHGLREQLRTIETHVCSFTNHKAVTMRICLPSLGRPCGRGFWSLRPHILTEENIEELQHRWQYWTRQRRLYQSWILWWQRFAKPQIMKFFRWKSRASYNEFQGKYQRLYSQLNQAYNEYYQHPELLPVINRLKAEMLTLQRKFSQTFIQINETYIAGEPLSSFQLGERRRKKTTISRIQNDRNEVLENSEQIEHYVLGYFADLYTETAHDNNEDRTFQCDRVIPEQDEANEACMHAITTAEIYTAIKLSAAKKSPGPDGIPKEFYLRSFDVIHRELNLILNEALQSNIPPDFVDGVIVLVKKKGSDNTVRSYRPISLLNYDYKLLARILKARLENVMRQHRIIGSVQKCANPEGNIYQATLALKDRIAQLIKNKQRAKLVSFDLEQAFDRVRRSFLHRTMCSLGINADFVQLLSQIADVSSSRLMINGHLSAPFPIQRSVRQGDPLSMHLFVLYLHPLLRELQRASGNDLLVAYADDITVIASSLQKIVEMRQLFSRFEEISGAKINWQKTMSMDVGFIEGNPLTIPWLQTVNKIKVLGVYYANSIRLMIKLNWDSLVSRFAQHVWLQSLRILTLHQKVIVVNTYMTSKIWFMSSILPPCNLHIAKITASIGSFLWARAPARVAMQQLARNHEKGGLKLQLPALKCKALLLSRHIKEIDEIPFYKSLILHENPIPADLPDVRQISLNLHQLPPTLQQHPFACMIHQYYVGLTDIPRVEGKFPHTNWTRCWRNVGIRQLGCKVKSQLYMMVNEKVEHRNLWSRIGRADAGTCPHCNVACETLRHKFSECRRVAAAWELLRRKTSVFFRGWQTLTFENLHRPQLIGVNRLNRIKILKLFYNYITFIIEHNEVIDIHSLEFFLDTEV